MTNSRRDFLKGAGAAALSAATIGSLQTAMSGFQTAEAASVGGYKALVCLFLLGGVDCHDVLIPYDQPNYDKYANIRSSMLGAYGSSRSRANLLALNPENSSDFGSRQFALPPELSGLHNMFEKGNAGIVANVGPLIQPINRTQLRAKTVPVPTRLFAHNHQQSTWMSSAPEGAKYGWGGRFADAALESGANTNEDFTTITSLGNEIFLTGERAKPYQIGLNGAFEIGLLDDLSDFGINDTLERHYKATSYTGDHLIQRDIANVARDSVELNGLFNDSLRNLVRTSVSFPNTNIGKQLSAIADTIAIRGNLSMSRQVFFAAQGGYDTHSNQARDLPGLLESLDEAIVAFYAAMNEMGLSKSVTLFTASDFGRTLAVNGDGTDHGWGGHHFVVGDAVQGKTIYGDTPTPSFGHELDSGNGRLIPTTSVEQFAEPLGEWFGLNQSELDVALPNRRNFTAKQQMKSLLKT